MKEKELFNLIREKLCPDLEPTSTYDYKDGYSKKYKLAIELKCRTDEYETLLIEKTKYDKLIEADNARYICSTPTKIYSFDLKKIRRPWWDFQLMPETTQFNRTKMVDKVVGFLPIEKGKDITDLLL
jgi:hypothetical protein